MYTASDSRYDLMQYKKCGESGLKLPTISLGLWHNFGENADFNNMCEMCFTAFDNGITHFDLANNYGPKEGSAELNFGKIINSDFKGYRDQLIISTKAGYYMWPGPYGDNGSRKYLMASIDQSLKRLNLDYVDIFYHHRMDKDTPLYETMGALSDIVKRGKALYVGLSNYDGDTLKKATKILSDLRCPYVINQNRYSIFDRTVEKNGALKTSHKLNKGMIVFSPLAQGLLSDRYINGVAEDCRIRTDGRFLKESALSADRLEKIKKLDNLAKERGQTLAQMALAWVYSKQGVTSVLIGASKREQILDNLKMTRNLNFTKQELKMIDEISL